MTSNRPLLKSGSIIVEDFSHCVPVCPSCGVPLDARSVTVRGNVYLRVTHEVPLCDWIQSDASKRYVRILIDNLIRWAVAS